MSKFSSVLLDKAVKVLDAPKTLDFDKIIDNDSAEVAKLQAVVQGLSIGPYKKATSLA